MAFLFKRVNDFDHALGKAVYQAARESWWRHFATAVSLLADEGVWFVVPITLLVVRLVLDSGFAGTGDTGAWLAARLFGSVGARELVDLYCEAILAICFLAATKLLFLRERPSYAPQDKHYIVNGDAYSFPSGHSFWAAFAQCRFIAFLGFAPAAALALPGTALVAWSRLAKGRHYPSDVLMGGTLGLLMAQVAQRVGVEVWMQCKLAVAFFEVGETLVAVSMPKFRPPGMTTGCMLLTLVFGLMPWGTAPPLGLGLSYALAMLSALCSLVQHPRLLLSLTPSNTSFLSRTQARLKRANLKHG